MNIDITIDDITYSIEQTGFNDGTVRLTSGGKLLAIAKPNTKKNSLEFHDSDTKQLFKAYSFNEFKNNLSRMPILFAMDYVKHKK